MCVSRPCHRFSLLGVLLWLMSPQLWAATFLVTNTGDSGPGSLRQAVLDAEASPGPDTIGFDLLRTVGETVAISLTGGQLIIDSEVEIDGSGAAVEINANSQSRLLRIGPAAQVEIIGLTLTGGDAGSETESEGGAIYSAGSLVLTTCQILDSQAVVGGGIYNAGGEVVARYTTIADNRAVDGGGIANEEGRVTLLTSAVHDNHAGPPNPLGSGLGGGILTSGQDAELLVVNSTFTGNAATSGAGLYNQSGSVSLDSVTVTGNSASGSSGVGGVASNSLGQVSMHNSILAGNLPPPPTGSCAAYLETAPVSLGRNLVGSECSARLIAGDLVLGVGALSGLTIADVLDTIAGSNGGPTLTHALVPGSPAVDAGSCAGLPALVDQRSLDRPFDVASASNTADGCDIGAFELDPDVCISRGVGQVFRSTPETDWSDAVSWSCGRRPDESDRAVIAPGHTVYVEAEEEVGTVQISGGASDARGGGRLSLSGAAAGLGVHGDFVNAGVASASNGKVAFRGLTSQEIRGGGETRFHDLVIANAAPGGAGGVQSKSPITVQGKAQIQTGVLSLQTKSSLHDVEIDPAGELQAPAGDEMEVSGDLQKAEAAVFQARGGRVVFNGQGKQRVSGKVTFDDLAVRKPSSSAPTDDVETGEELQVRGRTEILQGRMTAARASKFKDVVIAAQGELQAPAGEEMEVSGDLQKAEQGKFQARGGRVVFNGQGKQRVSGKVTFDDLAVRKPSSSAPTDDVETGEELQVRGRTEILQGRMTAARASKFKDVVIAEQGELQAPEGEEMEVSGDLQKAAAGLFQARGGRVVFNGTAGRQRVTLGGQTKMKVDLANREGLLLTQVPVSGSGRSDIDVCDEQVIIDEHASGDIVGVKCGSIHLSVEKGPVEALLGEASQIEVRVPDDTSVTAEKIGDQEIEILNLEGGAGTVVVVLDGTELEVQPGDSVVVADEPALCPGFDDTLDADDDGVPDGCDLCPGFDDHVDVDGDGVPDGCDLCIAGAQTACLLQDRFKVEGTMTDFDSPPRTVDVRVMSFPAGRAESDQAVFFESFAPGNFEIGVKMVNACELAEDHPLRNFWAFFGGLTNAETEVVIDDTVTGERLVWNNPPGVFPQTVGDTSAFPCVEGAPARVCTPAANAACLLDQRFEVTGTMKDFSAPPQAFEVKVMEFPGGRAESESAVFFESFTPGNFEIGVKMVDACELPVGNPLRFYWVFYGGLTNAGTRIEVTQLTTGQVDVWENPSGTFPMSEGRTSAFPCESD